MRRTQRAISAIGVALVCAEFTQSQSILHAVNLAPNQSVVTLAALGDVNGDGVPDYAIGAPSAAQGGAVHVVSGATGAIVRTIIGAGGEFGAAVARVGDFDADGIADLLVGAPTSTVSGSAAGEARIMSTGTGALLRQIMPQLGPFGAAAYRFGGTVAGLGEFTNDNVSEYLVASHGDVGVCQIIPPGFNCLCASLYTGAARVYSGASGNVLRAVPGVSGERFGSASSSVGDIDADGVADYLIATNGNLAGTTYCCGFSPCSAFPYHSAGFGVISGATGVILWTITGQPASVNAASIGDINADGVPDIAATFVAPIPGTTGLANAFLSVYSGATGVEIGSRYEAYVMGATGSYDVNSTIAGVGDANGDGIPDFIVGSPARGIVRLHSGLNLSTLWSLAGLPGEQFGGSLAAIGDLNNDGTLDIAIGSPGANVVHVISPRLGPTARVDVLGSICANGGTSPLIGSSLARLGTTARIVVSDAPPTVFAPTTLYLLLGTAPSSPVFMNAGPGFATPCELHIDPATALILTSTSAPARPWVTDVAVPNDPALNGVMVNLQAVAWVTNQFSGLPAGAGVSNGLRITVGQ